MCRVFESNMGIQISITLIILYIFIVSCFGRLDDSSCSFNCCGWNNGVLTLKIFIDSLDLCFVQEHWLLSDHLHRINDLSSDFLSVSVSGVDSSVLLCGRPYGGYSILYHRNLASCVVPLESCSNRFCGVRFRDSTGLSILLICVYMPSSSSSSLFNEYLNTLGELDGYIHSNQSDVVVIVGDFSVDFDRCNQITSLLSDFMSDHGLCSCDFLGMMCSLIMSTMMVLVVRGLIMLFAPSLSLTEYLMSVLCTSWLYTSVSLGLCSDTCA